MACFVVPTIVGLAVHSARKKFPENWHAGWLTAMVFGGAMGLGVEHYAHGEIVPWPPFFTAMATPADTAVMFKEMAVVGIPMTVALVLAWVVLVVVYEKIIAARRAPVGAGATI